MEYFVYALTKYAGAYAAVLGGLDAFVFTAGIGEHSAVVGAALCKKRRIRLGQSNERGTDGRGAYARAHSAGAPVTSVFSLGRGRS